MQTSVAKFWNVTPNFRKSQISVAKKLEKSCCENPAISRKSKTVVAFLKIIPVNFRFFATEIYIFLKIRNVGTEICDFSRILKFHDRNLQIWKLLANFELWKSCKKPYPPVWFFWNHEILHSEILNTFAHSREHEKFCYPNSRNFDTIRILQPKNLKVSKTQIKNLKMKNKNLKGSWNGHLLGIDT